MDNSRYAGDIVKPVSTLRGEEEVLTLILPTDPTQRYESVNDYGELNIGEIIEREDLELQVLDYYLYSPIVLGDDFRIAMAIVHPVDKPVPPKEEWCCEPEDAISSFACWHVLMHNGKVLRLEEKPNGDEPKIGTPFFHYCTDSLIEEPPKLDRRSLSKFMATAHKRTLGLKRYSYKKYVHPDALYREIYVVQLAPSTSKILTA